MQPRLLKRGSFLKEYFLGDRQLTELPSLAAATKQAYRSADVNDARSAFQVAEISDATPYQQLMACDGLGLCRRDTCG